MAITLKTCPQCKKEKMKFVKMVCSNCYTSAWSKARRSIRYAAQREYHKSRRDRDPAYRLKCNLRNRLYFVVVRIQKGIKQTSAIKDLGCTVGELMRYLENQFIQGMTWDNYGQWHVDHKKPLSSFDLTDPIQQLKACHYTNLQPLWALDNIRKSNKLEVHLGT